MKQPKPIDIVKVWREGLEVAMKVKGSQGKPHVEWLRPERTAIDTQLGSTLLGPQEQPDPSDGNGLSETTDYNARTPIL